MIMLCCKLLILSHRNCSERLHMTTCFFPPCASHVMPRAVVVQKSSHVWVSQFVNNFLLPLSSSIFNFPFLSSETKSLSLSVTAEILQDIHHLMGALDDYLFCSISLWSTDVMVCMYRRVALPCNWSCMRLLHLCTSLLHSVSLGQETHYARR